MKKLLNGLGTAAIGGAVPALVAGFTDPHLLSYGWKALAAVAAAGAATSVGNWLRQPPQNGQAGR